MDPTLANIIEADLQWIFVGGKGGVGKTTTSCALATLLSSTPFVDASGASRDRRVLIISTDPAHNLSDAFDQKLGKEPTVIAGRSNLLGMEIDPSTISVGKIFDSFAPSSSEGGEATEMSAALKVIQQALTSLPGIDELTVFTQIMRQVQEMAFDTVVFDTAPTGHTLRLLALPQTLNSTLDSIFDTKGMSSFVEMGVSMLSNATGQGPSDFTAKINGWREQIKEVQRQFSDNSKTAFVCVCIPEFLSVYETERLIRELVKCDIACENIVVNQLVLTPSAAAPCRMCDARKKIQGKYLAQIDELYEDFHVVRMPLHTDEVRGLPSLTNFSKFLLTAYEADTHGYQ